MTDSPCVACERVCACVVCADTACKTLGTKCYGAVLETDLTVSGCYQAPASEWEEEVLP